MKLHFVGITAVEVMPVHIGNSGRTRIKNWDKLTMILCHHMTKGAVMQCWMTAWISAMWRTGRHVGQT